MLIFDISNHIYQSILDLIKYLTNDHKQDMLSIQYISNKQTSHTAKVYTKIRILHE